jgi:multidrug efflux pump
MQRVEQARVMLDQNAAQSQMNPGDTLASRFNVSRWALEHPALTRYLMVVLLMLGVVAYFQLGQDEDPPFTFRAMVVQAFWPGASAEQMAEQVTDKIERSLQEVPHADVLRSYTKPGESLTLLQLKDSAPPKEVAESWYQARKHIGDMRSTLPSGVIGPVFNDDFGDVYGTIIALSADGFSDEELRQHAQAVRQRLLRVPDVAKVELFGVQPEKLFVEISHKRLATLGLDLNQVIAQLSAQNAVEGAGVLNAGSENLQVRIGGQFNTVEELQRFPIRGVNVSTGAAMSIRRRSGCVTRANRSSQSACRWPRAATSFAWAMRCASRWLQSVARCRWASRRSRSRTSPQRLHGRSVNSFAC